MKKLTIIVCVYNQEELVTRALDSIPKRDDIEIVLVDDGSTDNTLQNVLEWRKNFPVKVISLAENKGLGHAKNVAYDNSEGEYVHQLDSDDYLYTEEYEKVMDQLDGTDIVYCDLKINDGTIFSLKKDTQRGYCSGAARFIRREFLGSHRCPNVRAGEDWYLNEELQAIPHTDKFTRLVAYHYNFPRHGSLYDRMVRGIL